jgi:imidazolonepropionase-like amidohydrolase
MRIGLFSTVAMLLPITSYAATIAITNATLCTGRAVDGCKPGQTLVMRDDKIISVNGAVPTGAEIIDAKGKYVTPGLIDAYSKLGTLEVEAVDETSDGSAGKADFSAAFDVQYALNPASSAIAITRLEGVTRAVVVPGSDEGKLFEGFGAIIHLGDAPSLLVRGKALQSINLGEEGSGNVGGSRADAIINFINALEEARTYQANRANYVRSGGRDGLNNRLDTEALIPVLNGDVPLLISAHRAADIRAALALKTRYNQLKLILAGASEGWMVARELAAANVPVIIYAQDNLPRSFEATAATMANAARLRRAGVTVALGSFDQQQNSRLMAQYAGILTALPGQDAMSDNEALELITAAPAKIFALNAGTLEVGKQADVVMWDGPPLDLSSAPVRVFINGNNILMQSRQTKLRDRYLPIARKEAGNLPVQYNK